MTSMKEEEQINDNKPEIDRRIVKGLWNIGNTCFFNSVMQNLLAVDLFRDHFMKPAQFPEGPITSALRRLYVLASTGGSKQGDDDDNDVDTEFTLWSKGNETVNPDFLFSAICAKVRQFRGLTQQDSHEFLRCLLDNLHTEELVSLSNSKSTNSGDGEAAEGNSDECSNQRNNATLVDRVFQGQLCSTICCSKCGYCSVTHEPFYDLSLSLPRKPESMNASLPNQNDPSSVFGLLGGCAFSLPYKKGDSVAGDEAEVTQTFAELNADNELDVSSSSIGHLYSHDDIWRPFDNDEKAAAESSVVEGNNIDVCESESPLYGRNEGNTLFDVMPVTTETLEDMKPAVIPISVEGCLEEFTRPETLSGENGWRCPNCASKLVNGFDNLENATAKAEQGVGFNGRLNAESVHDSSAQGVSCSDEEGHSNKNVLRIFGVEKKSEIDGINYAERFASTSLEEEGGRISENLGKWDLETQNLTSSEEGHRLKKKRLETIENEAKINGISQEATKRYLIGKAPPILTIHLKRFEHDLFGRLKKLSDHVAFQETLDLRPYMDSR